MYRFVFLLLVVPVPGIASDPLDCVDTEFVRAFLSRHGSTPVSYSTEIPEHFEVRDVPLDMALIGSRNRKTSTTVIYRASQPVRDAYSALADALSDQGWEDITYERSPSRRGFQSADQVVVAEYCRDNDDTNLAVVVSDRSGQTLVSLEQYERKTLLGCMRIVQERSRDLRDMLPILDPPDGATTSNVRKMTTGHEISTSVDVSAGIGHKALLGHFGDQIRDQDWTIQATWASDLSSGSVWTRDTADHGTLVGTLHVYGAETDPARVRFGIDTADPAEDIDHGISSESSGGCD
ncbi:MAG TPA: hypothetical protein VK854_08785 [Woeseiaceae bacterium]|nr:hypothetical protein [Woeseiaceae bacterium]